MADSSEEVAQKEKTKQIAERLKLAQAAQQQAAAKKIAALKEGYGSPQGQAVPRGQKANAYLEALNKSKESNNTPPPSSQSRQEELGSLKKLRRSSILSPSFEAMVDSSKKAHSAEKDRDSLLESNRNSFSSRMSFGSPNLPTSVITEGDEEGEDEGVGEGGGGAFIHNGVFDFAGDCQEEDWEKDARLRSEEEKGKGKDAGEEGNGGGGGGEKDKLQVETADEGEGEDSTGKPKPKSAEEATEEATEEGVATAEVVGELRGKEEKEDVAAEPTPVPVPVPVPVVEPEPEPEEEKEKEEDILKTIARISEVEFEPGYSVIKEQSKGLLDKIVVGLLEVLDSLPSMSILIEGHINCVKENGTILTYDDPKIVGYENCNGLVLSARRAQSVANYFIERGFPADKTKAEGIGGARPLTRRKEFLSLNRRVEIHLQEVEL
jgi:outer membrane protein OmpA-like peptidoglycan-associated protein